MGTSMRNRGRVNEEFSARCAIHLPLSQHSGLTSRLIIATAAKDTQLVRRFMWELQPPASTFSTSAKDQGLCSNPSGLLIDFDFFQ